MKRSLLILLSLCILLLTGCSSGLSVTNGKVTADGKEIAVTEHNGVQATNVISENNVITYRICGSMSECDRNSLDILEDDMTVFKKGRYFSMYHDTEIVLHLPTSGGMYLEAYSKNDSFDTIDKASVVQSLYDSVSKIKLGEYKSVVYEGIVQVNVDGREFAVRPGELVIPGVLKVSTTTKQMSTPAKIGNKDVMTMSTDKYDYYQYGEVLLQVAKGTVLEGFIVLK